MSEKRIVILISGRGSNMDAIFRADIPLRIAAVISNNPDAAGLQTARSRNIATAVVDHRQFSSRVDFDDALATAIDSYHPGLVVLAGFMRILGDAFVTRYSGRMLNIHPSLLPAFPGLHTHRRAIAAGARIHGCTVHYVTPELDHGPIVIQAAVPVLADDTEDTLAERVLSEEHRIYPQALRWFSEGRLALTADDKVEIKQAQAASGALLAPPLES